MLPLLMGANVSSTSRAVKLKTCADDEYLVWRGTGFVCEKIQAGNVQIPDCSGDATKPLVTSILNGDVGKLECAPQGKVTLSQSIIDKINILNDKTTNLGTIVTEIEGSTPSAASVFKGTTTVTTKGAIATGNLFGVPAANEICKAQYGAGAHICSPYEIYYSVATGKITGATTVTPAWVNSSTWSTPVASPTEPLNGLNDNCAGYTYGTGDQKWVGTLFKWEVVAFTNRQAPKFVSGSGAPCNVANPIACCQ